MGPLDIFSSTVAPHDLLITKRALSSGGDPTLLKISRLALRFHGTLRTVYKPLAHPPSVAHLYVLIKDG